MEIKYGLISADSHAGFHRDDFVSRMSVKKWGDRIPHVAGVERNGQRVDGWSVYGEPPSGQVCNCPAVMGDPFPRWPKRWEEVPRSAFDPEERLKALDLDQVDAEVLFPNPPGGTFFSFGDSEFELDTVRAYNDTLSDWTRISDRYLPLAALPWLQPPENIVREIERAVEGGHRGINAVAGKGLPHLTDAHWDPIWDVCQALGVPVHFHVAAYNPRFSWVRWRGYTERQAHSASTTFCAVTPAQTIPHLIFSGITERFPSLKFVFAENGIGSLHYAMAACDHEWETRHLWTEGLKTRPSEIVRRQMYANHWFEEEGIKLREDLGVDNIMWESDFPHVTAYYPRSREVAHNVLHGVPEDDRRKILFENALRVYQIEPAAVS